MPQWGGSAAKCGRCGKSVYSAEERIGGGKSWHVHCFTCKSCNKSLESTTVTDKKDSGDPGQGEIYCKSCYGKLFGPKGYGYGAGAGTLSMDAGNLGYATGTAPLPAMPVASRSRIGSGPCCPRCGATVYSAEERISCGESWHIACFTCCNCRKTLDSTTVQDKNGEIYCKYCYGKLFAPKGYGYGAGAGTFPLTE